MATLAQLEREVRQLTDQIDARQAELTELKERRRSVKKELAEAKKARRLQAAVSGGRSRRLIAKPESSGLVEAMTTAAGAVMETLIGAKETVAGVLGVQSPTESSTTTKPGASTIPVH